MRQVLAVLVAFAGSLGLPATSWAQATQPGPVPIAIYPETPVRLELQMPDTRLPVALCQGACTAYLPPGKYRVHVDPGPDTRAGSRVVNVPGPSTLFVKPRSEGMHSSGLALGITGSALILFGMVTLVTTLDHGNDPDRDGGHQVLVPMAIVGIVVGLVLTPIGWVRYGKSLRPAVEVEPLTTVRH